MKDFRENISLLATEICKCLAYRKKYVNYNRATIKYEGVIKSDIPNEILSNLELLHLIIHKNKAQAVFQNCIINIKFYDTLSQIKSFEPKIALHKKEKRMSIANNIYEFTLAVYNPYMEAIWKFFTQETIYEMLCKNYKQYLIDNILMLCTK